MVLQYAILLALVRTVWCLEAIPCGNLLSPRAYAGAVYDGDDSVYIIGGRNSEELDEILRFNLTTESVELFGKLPEARWKGIAGLDGAGGFYYLGGYAGSSSSSAVSKFTASTPSAIDISSMPINQAAASGASDINLERIFAVGGTVREIVMYSANTNTASILHKLPYQILNGASVWVNDSLYQLSGRKADGYHSNDIYKFTPSVGQLTTWGTLPFNIEEGSAVTDGMVAYLHGGHLYGSLDYHLIKVNFESGLIESFEISNVKFAPLTSISSVYVPKSNRIYTFGGLNKGNYEYRSEIFYVQL